jgi:hypothetical protein
VGPGEWSSGKATQLINACARSDGLNLSWTAHAKAQMRDRDIVMSDLLHVMRLGFVLEEPVAATRSGFFRYLIEATTPNSEGRKVGLVIIPDGLCELKIVTVMWRDEL